MKKKRKLFSLHSISTKIILAVVLCGILLLVLTEYILTDTLEKLEEDLISDRLASDINYARDLIGEGEWNIRDGALYLGDTLIGDGTKENANLAPFLECEEKTGSFSYTFVICSDEGLTWTGDSKTGYMQGHYMRVAGSTLSPTGESIVGTYMDRAVARVLDAEGTYSGEANVAGGLIYCLYNTLTDADGEIVGAIVVGRSISEMRTQATSAGRQSFFVTVGVLFLICIGLSVIIYKWVSAIGKIRSYLEEIGTGIFPDKPLRLNTNDEMSEVAHSINAMTASLREKERIGAELELATNIQAHMLPCIFPAFPDHCEFDIYATMDPAKEVGGDFYDFFMLDEKNLAVVIADVSGKGVPAALFMVIAKTLIKNYTQTGLEPSNVFTKVNQLLCDGNEAGLFVTAWMGVLNLETGTLTYVNAGHNPPMIKHADGGFTYLRSRAGFVLAGMDTVRYKQNELQMEPGDRLFLYTDGVTEATNIDKKLYGEQRLSDYLNAHIDDSVTDSLKGLKSDIDAYVGEAEQFDDITMLMLSFQRRCARDTAIEQTFPASVDALPEVIGFVEQELEKYDCPMKAMMQITVAVEELFVNIASYAYPEAGGKMKLGIDVRDQNATLTFTDNGIAFDPLAKEDPDTTLSVEERGVGGLGILMVKKTMDALTYERRENQNIFTMTKNIG